MHGHRFEGRLDYAVLLVGEAGRSNIENGSFVIDDISSALLTVAQAKRPGEGEFERGEGRAKAQAMRGAAITCVLALNAPTFR